MKNSFGNNIVLTVFGESHGPLIGGVIDGLPAGFAIDEKQLQADMDKRRAKGKISTQRHEADQVHIVSGFFEGRTTGTPLTIVIENKSQHSADYKELKYRLRPSHADWSAFEKYCGFQDFRGGGHFSGRLTAVLTACGSICRQILAAHGVVIGSHLKQIYTIHDDPFDKNGLEFQLARMNVLDFPVLNEKKGMQMIAAIEQAAAEKDSVGGIIECGVVHFPAGIGEPIFDTIESELAHALFGVPAVKGISFGSGFDFANMRGSEANDTLQYENRKISSRTNHNAGINGGISNGMPIMFECVIKPTPSIFQKQRSVQFDSKENVTLEIKGRHDPCIAHRARIVIENMTAFVLLDCWMSMVGRRFFEEEKR